MESHTDKALLTDTKLNEKDVNRYWKMIINTMSEGLLLVAPDGTIMMVNKAFEEMTGYKAGEIIGNPCTTLECDACEMVLNSGDEHWCALFSKNQDKNCRCNLVIKNGSCLPVIKKATLLKNEEGELLGAIETLTDISELIQMDHEINQLSRQLEDRGGFFGLVGQSTVMRNVFELISKAAESSSPVIIFGESGTGKELAARAIHLCGPRKGKPYIELNCAAFNESLIESELFGHTKGAFTGAYQHRMGRFEEANGGDIFLDEIGDVPLSIQTKLLRVLESKQLERVGGNRTIDIDARIITATNKDLYRLIMENRFREDFFFRISVIPVHLPPLRNRPGDIPLLVNHFIKILAQKTQKPITGLTAEAMQAFTQYSWPGNVRELKSALEYAFTIADTAHIGLKDIPPRVVDSTQTAPVFSSDVGRLAPVFASDSSPLPPAESDKSRLINALQQTDGNQSKAARLLGVSRVTVWNRIKKYNINLDNLTQKLY